MINTFNVMTNVRVLSYWDYSRKQARVDKIRSLCRRIIDTWLCHQNVLFATGSDLLGMYQEVDSLYGNIVVTVHGQEDRNPGDQDHCNLVVPPRAVEPDSTSGEQYDIIMS